VFEIQNCLYTALDKSLKTQRKFKPHHPVPISRTSMNYLQHSWDGREKAHFQPPTVFVSRAERFQTGCFTTALVELPCLPPLSSLNLCRTLRTSNSKTMQTEIWALFKLKQQTQYNHLVLYFWLLR